MKMFNIGASIYRDAFMGNAYDVVSAAVSQRLKDNLGFELTAGTARHLGMQLNEPVRTMLRRLKGAKDTND